MWSPEGADADGGWPCAPPALGSLPPPSPRPPPPTSPPLMAPRLTWPFSAPSHIKGLHLNMALILRNFYTMSLPLGRRFGGLFGYTERDMELIYPFKKIFFSLLRESGYMHIQSTKPDTVGECRRKAPGSAVGGEVTSSPFSKAPNQQGKPHLPCEHCLWVKSSCEGLRALSTLMLPGHQIPEQLP